MVVVGVCWCVLFVVVDECCGFGCWLVGWLVDWSVAWLVGWLVCWLGVVWCALLAVVCC